MLPPPPTSRPLPRTAIPPPRRGRGGAHTGREHSCVRRVSACSVTIALACVFLVRLRAVFCTGATRKAIVSSAADVAAPAAGPAAAGPAAGPAAAEAGSGRGVCWEGSPACQRAFSYHCTSCQRLFCYLCTRVCFLVRRPCCFALPHPRALAPLPPRRGHGGASVGGTGRQATL